ncbi:MAG: hypothetical protein CMP11_09020 [Zetaproteobacteria bacterium]|nr:hypothetical protein [Pseudobdellovibrionaceae bacterium]
MFFLSIFVLLGFFRVPMCFEKNPHSPLTQENQREKECFRNIGRLLARSMFIEKRFIPIELSSYTISRLKGEDLAASSDLKIEFRNYLSLYLYDFGTNDSTLKSVLGKSPLTPESHDSFSILRGDLGEETYDFYMENVFCTEESWKIGAKNKDEQKKLRYMYSIETLKQSLKIKNTSEKHPNDPSEGFDDIEKRLKSLAEGFQEYIPTGTLRDISTASFNQMLGGIRLSTENFTTLKITNNHPELNNHKQWLKEIAIEKENESPGFLANLMFFWTGARSIPSDINTNRLKIAPSDRNPEYLPKAHTCFNMIDIPPYRSKAQFKRKLIQAVEMSAGTDDRGS